MTTILSLEGHAFREHSPNEPRANDDIRRRTTSIKPIQESEELNHGFPWVFEERDEVNERSALESLFPWLAFSDGKSESNQDTGHPNLNETDTRLASLTPAETHHFADVMASMGAAR